MCATRVAGPERALTIGYARLDGSVREAMLCLPAPEQTAALDDPAEGVRQDLDGSAGTCIAALVDPTGLRHPSTTPGGDRPNNDEGPPGDAGRAHLRGPPISPRGS